MRCPPRSPERSGDTPFGGGGLCGLAADDRGVSAIEYTLIAALIGVVAAALIATIGSDVSAPFNTIAGSL